MRDHMPLVTTGLAAKHAGQPGGWARTHYSFTRYNDMVNYRAWRLLPIDALLSAHGARGRRRPISGRAGPTARQTLFPHGFFFCCDSTLNYYCQLLPNLVALSLSLLLSLILSIIFSPVHSFALVLLLSPLSSLLSSLFFSQKLRRCRPAIS